MPGKLLLASMIALLPPATALAQIATDGTTGPRVSLSGGRIEVGAGLGTRAGGNLFHSFETFNVNHGQTVTFTGPEDSAQFLQNGARKTRRIPKEIK